MLGSNPTSACQWVCGFGKLLSPSLHFLFCQMETYLPQNRGEDLKEPMSVKSSAQCLACGKRSVNTSYHLFSPNHRYLGTHDSSVRGGSRGDTRTQARALGF